MPDVDESQDGADGFLPKMLDAARAFLDRVETRLKERQGRRERRQSQPQLQVKEAPPRREPASPWTMPPAQATFLLLALLAAIVVVFVRLYRLETLQNEWYGDVIEVREQLDDIFAGGWVYRFVCGCGPLFSLLITPIIALVGPSYLGLKLGSVVVSLGVIVFTYLFARRLVNDWFALLAAFVSGISSWMLIFSRLGNMPILVPLLVAISLWLVTRVVQGGHWGYAAACGAVSAAGLHVYPQSFVLPGVTFVTLLCLHWTGLRVKRNHLLIFVAAALVFAIPFVMYVVENPAFLGSSSYLGGKLATAEGESPLRVLARNVVNALGAFHVHGDEVWRSNVREQPHLDVISGALFLVGIVFWLLPERRRWSPALLVPFLLLQVPSMLALNAPREVPSSSRTIGIAAPVYILVASGLWWPVEWIVRRWKRWVAAVLAAVLLLGMVWLNARRYFQEYIAGLVYHNTPVAGSVADYANTLPSDTQVYMVGCCWVAGMPETQAVEFGVTRLENLHWLDRNTVTCDDLALLEQPAVLIWGFESEVPAPQLEPCKDWLPGQLYTHDDVPVFRAAPLRFDAGEE